MTSARTPARSVPFAVDVLAARGLPDPVLPDAGAPWPVHPPSAAIGSAESARAQRVLRDTFTSHLVMVEVPWMVLPGIPAHMPSLYVSSRVARMRRAWFNFKLKSLVFVAVQRCFL